MLDILLPLKDEEDVKLIGVLCFSGGLYLVVLAGQIWAFLAPIGGMAMIFPWLIFTFGFWRSRSG